MAEIARLYTQINFSLKELEEVVTREPEKFVFSAKAELGMGITAELFVAASSRDDVIEEARARLAAVVPLERDQHIAWTVRKK